MFGHKQYENDQSLTSEDRSIFIYRLKRCECSFYAEAHADDRDYGRIMSTRASERKVTLASVIAARIHDAVDYENPNDSLLIY